MRRGALLLAVLAGRLFAQELPSLDHAMDMVQHYVEHLETSAPAFICRESIVSSLFQGKKLKKQTKAEAVLTTTRVHRENFTEFIEHRSEMTINGRKTKRNEITGPFVWKNGPAYSDLHFLFNSQRGVLCLDRRLVGLVRLNGASALLIETHVSPAVGANPDCEDMRPNSADSIWLDPSTLNVMRIQSQNPPATRIPGSELTLTVDYQPVTFDGEEFWLPSHFISELQFPAENKRLTYEAWFTDYHKFEAQSTIHIDSVP